MNDRNPLIGLRVLVAAVLLLAAPAALAGRDVVLVLDNSGSMRANDPARLAGPAVEEFIRGQPPDTRVAIILFGKDARLVMPLTPVEVAADGDAQQALARFDYRDQWTQIAAGVERALYELRNEARPDARRVIVLMTDGLIDTGDAARNEELNAWLRGDLAAQAARDKVGIFGIAFTERADYLLLQSLAATTGAEYFRVFNPRDISKTLLRIETMLSAEPAAALAAKPPAATTAPAIHPPAGTQPSGGAAPAGRGKAWLLPLLAGLLALGVAGIGVWWLRRPQPQAVAAPVPPPPPPPPRDHGPQGVLFDVMERHEIGDRPVVIGRAGGNDPTRHYVIIPDKTVGRWHATIERRGQTFWLRDEGSVNGTYINGERVVGERPLKHRDQVRFHNHVFEFEIPELHEFDRTVMHSAAH